MLPHLPNLSPDALQLPQIDGPPPRILLLYGSLRERSDSRFATPKAEGLLRHFGGETRVFHANGLPRPDDAVRPTTPGRRSCGICACGPRGRSGPAPNGMVR